jgi:hypothetical protein
MMGLQIRPWQLPIPHRQALLKAPGVTNPSTMAFRMSAIRTSSQRQMMVSSGMPFTQAPGKRHILLKTAP